MKYSTFFGAMALTLALPGGALAQASGPQPVTVKTARLAKALTERDLDHAAWRRVPAREIVLTTAFPAHESITGTSVVGKVHVQAGTTAEGVLVRLKWKDASPDTVREPGRFADGVAIQFALDRKPDTIPFMGGAGKTVNIWYWSAARNAGENLVADGFGTLTRLEAQDVRANGRHAAGEWTVVFFRPYRTAGGGAIRLSAGAGRYPIAFAVWEGANAERDGFKAVTLAWQTLAF